MKRQRPRPKPARRRGAPAERVTMAQDGHREEIAVESSASETDRVLAAAQTVVMVCDRGHTFSVRLDRTDYGYCPHGVEITTTPEGHRIERPAQVSLVCPVCGGTYDVVGRVGMRPCPRCGTTMLCPRCLAAASSAPAEQMACPTCASTLLHVAEAPAVIFRGDVKKTIGGITRARW